MPQLHSTDVSVVGLPVLPGGIAGEFSPADIDPRDRPELVDGTPFILGDDGSYDLRLNRFFRECPTIGVRSANSVRAYARDLLTWIRFLAERRDGKSIWEANRQDVIAYHRTRRLTAGPGQIAGASWNRSITALEKFYGWALDEGLLAGTPFSRNLTAAPGRDVARYAHRHSRSFREPGARPQDMRFVGMDRFVAFRDVGLRGHLPDGSPDPAWRGHNGERDALFAELLTATGMRLTEASSLLPGDLPRHDDKLLGDARSCPVLLPPAICKGSKGREIRVPRRLLRRIDDYIAIERVNAVARWRARRGWDRVRGPLYVSAWHGRSAMVGAAGAMPGRRRLDAMGPAERARLVVLTADNAPAEPAGLWLSDAGDPMRPASWEAVFLRADARCRARDLDLHVTPHMLRHTFAVHMLSLLIRAQIGAGVADQDRHGAVYRRVIGDPLQKLQRLLGHSSIASTYIYLDSLEESRSLVDAAALRWADDLGAAAM
jgi:site-specific recombinase XerD